MSAPTNPFENTTPVISALDWTKIGPLPDLDEGFRDRLKAHIVNETERITVGWGIISPYTRHPIQVAMEARVTQEAAGEGRFRLGFGASKIFMKEIGEGEGDGKPARPLTAIRESIEIVRGVLSGQELSFAGKEFSATVPPLSADADVPRWQTPVYVAGTGPKMQQLSGEVGDGLLTGSF